MKSEQRPGRGGGHEVLRQREREQERVRHRHGRVSGGRLARPPWPAGAMARSAGDDSRMQPRGLCSPPRTLTMTRATTGCGTSQAYASAAICFMTSRIIAQRKLRMTWQQFHRSASCTP